MILEPCWTVTLLECRSRPPGHIKNIAFPLAVLLLALGSVSIQAQDSVTVDHPLQSADTSSPRATLKSFIDSIDELHRRFYGKGRTFRNDAERRAVVVRAMRCLDLSQVPSAVRKNVGKETCVYLKEVIDRIELPTENDWPGEEQVVETDGEAEKKGGIARWSIPNTEITIAKVTAGPRIGEFLFTAETVERADEFYRIVEDLPHQERQNVTPGIYHSYLSEPGWMLPRSWIHGLPSWTRTRWLGQAVWQWAFLIITLVLAFGLMLMMYVLGKLRARDLRSNVIRYLITLAFPLAAMLVPLLALYYISEHIHISGNVLVVIAFSLRIVFLFALIIVLLGVSGRIAELMISTPWIRPRGLDAQLVRLICRVGGIVAAVIVFLEGGRQFGIPLTTLLTSAGVGGLAVALAAQDALKNVFGSIMISLDKPFSVGERIVAKGYDGIVEEIGLRSTKIRLLTGHQTSVPNEEMARSDIENIGRRPFIRRSATIQMPSTTPITKVDRALEIARNALDDHEGMKPELPPRVFLSDINEASVGIVIYYWYHPPNFWDYLAFTDRLNRQIMKQFEAEQIPFATPFLTIQTIESGKQDDIEVRD